MRYSIRALFNCRDFVPARPAFAALAALLLPAAVAASEHVVTAYSNLTFSPPAITIHQGDTIRFENGGGAHNVHADDDRFVCSVNCSTDNGPSSVKWSVVVRFDELGTIGYYCDKHGGTGGGMRGSIVVIDRVFVDGFDTPAGVRDRTD
ncbi:MAG TPA: plastocyanin/azurin family copper-binding protein [Dokdonella sp.]